MGWWQGVGGVWGSEESGGGWGCERVPEPHVQEQRELGVTASGCHHRRRCQYQVARRAVACLPAGSLVACALLMRG